MSNVENLRDSLQRQLQSLSGLVSELQDDRPYREIFDEFLREHEFDLALHVLCDVLLKPQTPAVNQSALKQIQELHRLMGLEDECVKQLQDKMKGR